MTRYAPSLMCANYLNLEKDIRDMDRAHVDFYHIDIMDNHFVPNLSMNLEVVRQLKTITDTPMDVHLMVDSPESCLTGLQRAGVDYVTFHIESVKYPIRMVNEIKGMGIKAGAALNPATRIEELKYFVKELDYILVMTVEPGYAGQKFIPGMLEKIKALSEMRNIMNRDLLIEVDGSISRETGRQCVEAGADILVLGTSSIFRGSNDLYTSVVEFKNSFEFGLKELA